MIYFLKADPLKARDAYRDVIKIGTTIRLSQRLRQIEVDIGQPVIVLGVMPGGYAEESALHQKFAALLAFGEWFRAEAVLTDLIKRETVAWDGKDERRQVGINIKARKEWTEWLARGAAHCGLSVSQAIDQAVREFALEQGFDKPAPKR